MTSPLTSSGKQDATANATETLTVETESGPATAEPESLTGNGQRDATGIPFSAGTRQGDESSAAGERRQLLLLGKEEGGRGSGAAAGEEVPPAFGGSPAGSVGDVRSQLTRAAHDWLSRTPSPFTRDSYARDLRQFLTFRGIPETDLVHLIYVRPGDVAAWRDSLETSGATNSTIRRKLTTLRSLFSYLQTYGYTGANPAHGKFVKAPSVPRDGKTVGLSPKECRLLLDAPDMQTPAGVRDRALLAVLAYTGCRVGELCRLRVRDYRASGGHKILAIFGKGNKERIVPLHAEAFERLDAWLEAAGIREDFAGAIFRPAKTARAGGRDGFCASPLTRRSVELIVERYVHALKLDPAVTVHSLRVTALTTARERGSDIIDLQDFAGHADPRTTLTYIRTRDRLSKSPAYLLAY
jgi:integrase/recombinase XerD